jgi:hypothetical protein
MDPDAQPLLALDLNLDHGAVGQVILEHHICPIPTCALRVSSPVT